jgi:hypothetical protein
MRRNVSLAKPPRGRQAELRETGGLIALGSSLSLSSLGETGRTGSLFPHCATHDAMPSLFVCEWRSRGERERDEESTGWTIAAAGGATYGEKRNIVVQ